MNNIQILSYLSQLLLAFAFAKQFYHEGITIFVVLLVIATVATVTKREYVVRCVCSAFNYRNPMILRQLMPQSLRSATYGTAIAPIFKTELPIFVRKSGNKFPLLSIASLLLDSSLFSAGNTIPAKAFWIVSITLVALGFKFFAVRLFVFNLIGGVVLFYLLLVCLSITLFIGKSVRTLLFSSLGVVSLSFSTTRLRTKDYLGLGTLLKLFAADTAYKRNSGNTLVLSHTRQRTVYPVRVFAIFKLVLANGADFCSHVSFLVKAISHVVCDQDGTSAISSVANLDHTYMLAQFAGVA